MGDLIARLRRSAEWREKRSVGAAPGHVTGEDLREAANRIEALEAALRPFAATGAVLEPKPKDAAVWAGQTPAPPITFGDLRRAAATVHVHASDNLVAFDQPDQGVVLVGRSLADIQRQ